MVNLLRTIRLVQSICKCKFPSVEKPLRREDLPPPKISPSKRAFEKYRPRGLFSEFYGIGWHIRQHSTDVLADISTEICQLTYQPIYQSMHWLIYRLICRPIYGLRGAQITQDPKREGYTQSNVRTITNKRYHRKVLLISYHLSDQNI